MAKDYEMDVRPLMKRVTLYVKIRDARKMAILRWIAVRLFLLGAWVLNCNIEIEQSSTEIVEE